MSASESVTFGKAAFRIGQFESLDPTYSAPQEKLLERLAQLHACALEPSPLKQGDITEQLRRRIERFGCDSSRIGTRYFEEAGFLPPSSESQTDGYDSKTGWTQRMDRYRSATQRVFESWYPEANRERAPGDVIHVSCTGYLAPSAAQNRIAELGLGDTTRVTHAYHMGCYAALPALRLAEGLLRAGSKKVDVAHTELCTLHLQVGRTEPEQLVIQSLFGDGHIRWTASLDGTSELEQSPHFEVLGHSERLLPESGHAMSWNAGETGWQMTLARDVPDRIRDALPRFVSELLQPHQLALQDCIGAVHPGGPKIIEEVAKALELSPQQIRHSHKILFERGNLSSATLPHIWESILSDPSVPLNTPILSLAFGPGLTLCGSIMVKRVPRP